MVERTRLEDALRDLGRRLDIPGPPDVTASVRARIEGSPARRRRVSLLRAAVAALVAIMAAGGVVTASPTVRAALAELFDFAGVQVQQPPGPPTQPSPQLPGVREVTLAEARSLARFPVHVPPRLGKPDTVRVSDGRSPRVVSLIYRPGTGRPEPAADGVAVLLDQFDGAPAPAFEKFVHADNVQRVSIGDTPALWVQGPHEVIYVDRTGQWRTESARLAANTLIWQINDVTLRLEGNLSKRDALTIARSTP